MNKGLSIESVKKNSIAWDVGIEPGDVITKINDQPLRDILDYRFLIADETIVVELQKSNGLIWQIEIEKEFDESLGIDFGSMELGEPIRCQNQCIFCFVSQMPPAMRKTLYVKDDDYRLSFLQGNFITMTNIGEKEIKRIIQQRLTPLYVSVHTTNPVLRTKMMGNARAGDILQKIEQLTSAGITIHAQIVLCPTINDGKELENTIKDLTKLWPGLSSLALVPVGLTGYREGLYPLSTYNKQQAREIVLKAQGWQKACRDTFGYPVVFAADEFYLLADIPIPETACYADYPQIENGIGLTRIFLEQWYGAQQTLPQRLKSSLHLHVVTGTLAKPILQPLINDIHIENLKIDVHGVENSFLGHTVTVAGLISGQDIIQTLQTKISNKIKEILVIPNIMLRNKSDIFLDNYSLQQLEQELGISVIAVENPKDLFDYIRNKSNL